jgi:hypothetical protein
MVDMMPKWYIDNRLLGEYRHSPFMLEDHNLPKSLRLYDVSQGVSTAELGRSGSSTAETGGAPPSNKESYFVQQSTDALTSPPPPLQPAFEFEPLDRDKAKTYAGLGIGKKHWDGGSARPAYQQRISSWSDTRSAWSDEAFWMGGGKERVKDKGKGRQLNPSRANSMLGGTREEMGEKGGEREVVSEKQVESDDGADRWKKLRLFGARRYVFLFPREIQELMSLQEELSRPGLATLDEDSQSGTDED